MKSKQQKRDEAYRRMQASTWENSHAKRTGTKTEEEWKAAKQKRLGVIQ